MSQINLTIDGSDSRQVSAALAFFQTLAGEELTTNTLEEPKKEAEKKVIKKAKEFIEDQPKKEGVKTEPTQAPAPEITLNQVRELVAKKVSSNMENKPKIREWLGTKEASKTADLKPEFFGEYVEYLNTLA